MSELPPQYIEIHTERFVLRSAQPSDARVEFENWTLDSLIAEMMNANSEKWSLEKQRTFFTAGLVRPDQRIIGIFPKEINSLIGFFILKLNKALGNFTISTLIGNKDWRGQDVMGECSDAIYKLMFEGADYHKAKANILPSNKAMIWNLAQTKIWKREGRLRKQLRNFQNNERLDVLVYGLLKSDWQKNIHAQVLAK